MIFSLRERGGLVTVGEPTLKQEMKGMVNRQFHMGKYKESKVQALVLTKFLINEY